MNAFFDSRHAIDRRRRRGRRRPVETGPHSITCPAAAAPGSVRAPGVPGLRTRCGPSPHAARPGDRTGTVIPVRCNVPKWAARRRGPRKPAPPRGLFRRRRRRRRRRCRRPGPVTVQPAESASSGIVRREGPPACPWGDPGRRPISAAQPPASLRVASGGSLCIARAIRAPGSRARVRLLLLPDRPLLSWRDGALGWPRYDRTCGVAAPPSLENERLRLTCWACGGAGRG